MPIQLCCLYTLFFTKIRKYKLMRSVADPVPESGIRCHNESWIQNKYKKPDQGSEIRIMDEHPGHYFRVFRIKNSLMRIRDANPGHGHLFDPVSGIRD
jgi:hypothetical protein